MAGTNPKKKLSATRSGNRRSKLALQPVQSAVCSHCKALITPHTVCTVCGYYKGKLVIPAKAAK